MMMSWRRILGLTCIAAQEFNTVRRRPLRTWPSTLSVPPFPRRGYPIYQRSQRSYTSPRPVLDLDRGTGTRRKSSTPLNGSLLCVHMFQIRASPARRDYCDYYRNVRRDKRKKMDQDCMIPSILEPVEDPDFSGDGSSKARPGATRLLM
jgi:hypothetical protein